MKQNYSEGTWFAVPLRRGGFGIGVVGRAVAGKPIILSYFFGPCRESVPKLDEVSTLKAPSAVLVLRVGDLGLIRGAWPVIGKAPSWNRLEWPMPVFIRREILSPYRNWRIYYSETDPSKRVKEELEDKERPDLPVDSLSGSGAAEIKLTKLLGGGRQRMQLKSPLEPAIKKEKESLIPIESGAFRAEVISQLRNIGSDTNKAHNFDFFLYLPSKTAACAAAEKIREKEFKTEVSSSPTDNKWLCRASKLLVPESAPLDQISSFFERIAATLHGNFDGWESDVIKV